MSNMPVHIASRQKQAYARYHAGGDVTVGVHELQETQPETPRALDIHEQPEQGPWLIGPSTQKSMANRRRLHLRH